MKKMKIFAVSTLVLLVAGATMSFTVANNIVIPTGVQNKVLEMAVESNYLSQSDAQTLIDTNAAQQCLDAFVSSNYDPSAAVDKLAEIAVSAGKARSKAEAKAMMKTTAEQLRKDESSWALLYNLLGL